jgi:Kef-type K+ transport system membrane component KefB
MHALIVAAGFVEPRQMLGTVIGLSLAYLISVALPLFLFLRWRLERSRRRKAMLAGVVIAIGSPFAVRLAAIGIQGPYWADWHFVWLYLLRSSLIVSAYLLTSAIWLAICRKKRPNQPPEPTALSITICAYAQLAPASTVAHL